LFTNENIQLFTQFVIPLTVQARYDVGFVGSSLGKNSFEYDIHCGQIKIWVEADECSKLRRGLVWQREAVQAAAGN
jgi:hypothetical protein